MRRFLAKELAVPDRASGRGTQLGPPRAARAPDWSAAPSSTEGDRALFTQRIAYYGKVVFLLSLAFYVRNVALIAWREHGWPPLGHPALALHVGAMGVSGLQWLLCRSGERSRHALELLDIGGLVGTMALYTALTVAEASGFEHAVAVQAAGAEIMLLALIMLFVVLTHAIVVPASVGRMFWVSAATSAIAPIGAYAIAIVGFPAEILASNPFLPLTHTLYVAMWAIVTVVIATIAARIIHGLQQKVRAANEIGQYTLESKIGEGGMGVVYLARHALLRRATAVKLLPPERAGEQAVRRFEQEVQLTSRLTHANTISIYDFGRTPDGIFYYAMEYIDGITLDDLVAHAGAQPPGRVVQVLKQVLGALAEAHDLGLIHRDIKPANLMLCVRGGVPDQVKVLDFGLVKELGVDGAGLSMTGGLLGTPAYLAPEAIVDPAAVDGRADIYAVGAVAYYLLVGKPVFEGQTVVEICVRHLHHAPTPPSLRAPQPIPKSLEQLVLRCLAKNPADRPACAADAVALLEKLDGIATWSDADARTWWRQSAPDVTRAAKAKRDTRGASGPRTVAIDMARRASGERLRVEPEAAKS